MNKSTTWESGKLLASSQLAVNMCRLLSSYLVPADRSRPREGSSCLDGLLSLLTNWKCPGRTMFGVFGEEAVINNVRFNICKSCLGIYISIRITHLPSFDPMQWDDKR